MFAYTIKRQPKNTVEIQVTIPFKQIQDEYEKVFETTAQELSVDGFRKGKVPKEIAQKNIKQDRVYEQAVQNVLPTVYQDIVKKESLKPVVSPKISLQEAQPGEDWKFVFVVAEEPTVVLKDYRKSAKDIKQDQKKEDIWVPGKEPSDKKEETPQEQERKRSLLLQKILDGILQESECEIADILIEQGVDQKLTQLLDDIRKIGLTTERYFASKGTSMDQVKEQYRKEVEDMYKLDYILMAIGDKEGIDVSEQDYEDIYKSISNEEEREQIKKNAYMYAPLIRKQKIVNHLLSL